MKFFRWASATAFISLFAVSGVQALTAKDVATSIDGLTMKSESLQKKAASVTFVNFAFVAPGIAQDFVGIVTSINVVISVGQANRRVKFGDADAQIIVKTLTTFVHVHQALLSIVISKHGILALGPLGIFTEPIRQALVQLEAAVDSFAFILIGMIPTREKDGMQAKNMLDISIGGAITIYS